jgi:hypothetical protein
MRTQRVVIVIALSVASLAAQVVSQADPQSQQKKPLANVDVVTMVKAGLAESTILLAIEQNPTAFDTSPTALVDLKNAGVPSTVIDGMLRSTPPSPAPTPTAAPPTATSESLMLAEGTYYKGASGFVRIAPQMMGGGGATHVGKMFVPGLTPHMVFTFRGAEAPLQIGEKRPTFYFKQSPYMTNVPGHSERDIVLVRFDKKKDHRELQMTSGASVFTFKAGFSKEKTPDIVVNRISESVFTITPQQDLAPGEYLLTFGLGASGFDFGITVVQK